MELVLSRGDRAALHLSFDLEALPIAEDRRHRQRASAQLVGHRAVGVLGLAIDLKAVPLRRVTDVVDGHVVVLAPEERDRIEALAAAEDVAGRGLALALGDDPVLDAK